MAIGCTFTANKYHFKVQEIQQCSSTIHHHPPPPPAHLQHHGSHLDQNRATHFWPKWRSKCIAEIRAMEWNGITKSWTSAADHFGSHKLLHPHLLGQTSATRNGWKNQSISQEHFPSLQQQIPSIDSGMRNKPVPLGADKMDQIWGYLWQKKTEENDILLLLAKE